MEANPVRIVQYFDGEKQSIIPLFQRPYTWNKRNWQTLWEDIMTYYEDDDYSSSHFMGAVVSIPAKTVPVGVKSREIIYLSNKPLRLFLPPNLERLQRANVAQGALRNLAIVEF